jgi:hypothetical protein
MAFIEREVALAVAATVTALSPKARDVVRKGAVYGLAGVLKAGGVLVSTARGAAHGAQEGVTGHQDDRPDTAAARPARTRRSAQAKSEATT